VIFQKITISDTKCAPHTLPKQNNRLYFLITITLLICTNDSIIPTLHGDPSPPKKPTYPPFSCSEELGTLRKLTQIVVDSIGGLGDLLAVPRRSRQISGMFQKKFEDVQGRFQRFFG
jgi:hypothetical protein